MKKVLFFSVGVLMCILGLNTVKATTCADIDVHAPSDYRDGNLTYMYACTGNTCSASNAAWTYGYSMYHFEDVKNNNFRFASYCINAGITTGIEYSRNMKCTKVLFDTSDSTKSNERMAYDAGIVEILEKGYNYKNSSSDSLYVATNSALRAYMVLWYGIDNNGSNGTYTHKEHKALAKQLLKNNDIRAMATYIKNKGYNIKTNDSEINSNWNSVAYSTSGIDTQTQELVLAGLKASKEYIDNGAATITSTKGTVAKSENKRTVTYVLTLKNFKKSPSVTADLICNNCAANNISYSMSVNGTQVNNTNVDLLSLVQDGSGKVTVTIEFINNNPNSTFCNKLDYKLNIKYQDETINSEAFEVTSEGCRNNDRNAVCQYFYLLYAVDEKPRELKLDKAVTFCDLPCKELERLCNAGNPSACEVFESEYDSTCSKCGSKVTTPVCSKTDTTMEIQEGGYYPDIDSCNVDEKPNILKCIVDKKDENKNSYEATTILNNNKYCSVWCKEDYHITLPGVKEIDSGRYFTLKAGIKGTKTCYTNKIDKKTFETDYETARKAVIDAYNNYEYWRQAAAVTSNHDTSSCSHPGCSGCSGGSSGCSSCTPPVPSTPCSPWSCSSCSASGDIVTKEWSYEKYSYDGVRSELSDSYSDGQAASCGCCSCSGRIGHDPDADHAANASSALTALNQAIANYENIIAQYNKCSSWTMEYKLKPDVYFWYEESYMNDAIKDKLDTVGNISTSSKTQNWCQYTGSTTDENYQGTDDAYEKCNGSSNWSGSELYANSASQDGLSRFICNQSGCYTGTAKIQRSVRVKASISGEGSYITPTQFHVLYPTGAIVVSDRTNNQIENSTELTNKLPVGLNTVTGVYNYALIVKNLGEYYSRSDKLGRIWGDEESVVTAASENACIKNNSITTNTITGTKGSTNESETGAYVCAYKVNCPDCPIVCDPVCDDDCPTTCPIVCENCLVNGKTNISYRPITPGNINPNDRDLGKNWQFDERNISTSLEMKAYVTTKEIEESGESIYDSTKGDYVLKVRMDSGLISAIRQYNDNNKDDGYLNNTLKCYDFKEGGKTYKNIFCYSEFIDEMSNRYSSNFNFYKTRPVGNARNDSASSDYWNTWSKVLDNHAWTITTVRQAAISKNYNGSTGIGPSWK